MENIYYPEKFYPYGIEFNKYVFIDPLIFKDNPEAKDISHIGTTTEAERIINLYFPGATIEEKHIDSNSQKITLGSEVIGYIVGNVFRYG